MASRCGCTCGWTRRAGVASFVFHRWGDPDRTGTWAWHPFGGEVTAHHNFGGVTVPSAGRIGWYYGTDHWPDGEFFRFELDDLRLGGAIGSEALR
jgi:hypothetical protein